MLIRKLKIILVILLSILTAQILNSTQIPLENQIIEQEEVINITQPKYVIEIVYIDPSFTGYEISLIEQSMLQWESATNNIVRFYTVYDLNYNVIFAIEHSNTILNVIKMKPVSEVDPITIYMDIQIKGMTLGLFDLNIAENTSEIKNLFIVSGRIDSDDEYRAVVMHELGHSLGLMHITNENTIMYPNSGGSSACIAIEDLEQFCLLYYCDEEELNPCTTKTRGPVCSTEGFSLL